MEKKKTSDSWLMRFLISIIGTAIGVGLTFAVNNTIESDRNMDFVSNG
jgi:hypothetical protein